VKQSLDSGWYGKGYYQTTFPEYGMNYIKYPKKPEPGNTYTLVGSYFNPGRVKTVATRCVGEEIASGFDGHYVKVNQKGFPSTPHQGNKDKEGSILYGGVEYADEYCISDGRRIYPRFLIELRCVDRFVVWFDPNIYNLENKHILEELKTRIDGQFPIYGVSRHQDAINLVVQKTQVKHIRLMSNGRDGEAFIRPLRERGVMCDVLVFTMTRNQPWVESLLKQYPQGKITITLTADPIYDFVDQLVLL
jgi:hypothetical protein